MRTKLLLSACLLFFAGAIAKAQVLVTPTITQNGSSYTYDYLLSNSGSTSIIGFSLALPVSITSISAPEGWTADQSTVGSDTLIQWGSSDIPFDLPALGTLGGFQVVADAPPGSVDYSALDENFADFPGQTLGPAISTAAPEPSPLALMTVCLLVIGIVARRRSKRNVSLLL